MKTLTNPTASFTPAINVAIRLADEISRLDLDSITKERVSMTNLICDAIKADRAAQHADLLAALEAVETLLDSLCDQFTGDQCATLGIYACLNQSRAAIARAKGVQS